MQVFISRFGHDEIELELAEGTTVEIALSRAGISLGTAQAFVSGVRATPQSILEDGDVVNVVTPKQGA